MTAAGAAGAAAGAEGRGDAPPKPEAAAAAAVAPGGLDAGTWATKTALGEGESSPKHAASRVGCEGSIPVVAEEEPSPHANGQEPPCCVLSPPRSPKIPAASGERTVATPSRPLPKVQLAEAAKLAETRRRFDNDRYKQQLTSPPRCGRPGPVEAEQPASWTPKEAASTSPLSLRSVGSGACGADLPEGVDAAGDDGGDTRTPSLVSSRTQSAGSGGGAAGGRLGPGRKDAPGKNAFDRNEEALMTEILEDFNAV